MMKSLYDCMAHMIRILVDNTDERFYEKYLAITPERSEIVNLILSKKFPEILEESNAKIVFAPHYCNNEVFERICEFADRCINSDDKTALVRLLSKLDSGLSMTIDNLKIGSKNNLVLNDNSLQEQIQLLPRCYSSWAHNNRDKVTSNNLNNFLNHMYYVDTRELFEKTGCSVSHKLLDRYEFNRALEKGYLQIGISPLSDGIELEAGEKNVDGEYGTFYINSLSDVEHLVENAVSILECAKKKEIDILCFPEMLGHPEVNKALKKRLQAFPENNAEQYPALTVCPSYWNEKSNNATVLDNMGNEVCSQNKQHAFPFEKERQTYLEGIEPDNHIEVLHCEGIGRIAIMICKDALNRKYLYNILENLKISLLIIPSFSTGYYDFEDNLSICKTFDCTAIWINSCSVQRLSDKASLDKIGLVMKNGKKTNIKNGTYSFKKKECKKLKGKTCKECLYIQKLYFSRRDYG